MEQVAIQDLKLGMVVAKDVYGRNDNLILGKGTALSQETIAQVSQAGLQHVWIESIEHEKELDKQKIEQIKEDITETLNAKFQSVSHNPLMMELKRICINHLIKKRTS